MVMDKTTSTAKIRVRLAGFVCLLYCLSFGTLSFSQSIAVTSISPNPACGGQNLLITFTATSGNGNPNHYSSSSVFQAYLSSNGGGGPYTLLGNLTLNPYGFLPNNGDVNTGVQGTIALPATTGIYKIAVGSTSPTFNASGGAGASLNFNINTAPVGGSVTGGTTVCPGSNSTLLTLSGYTGTIDKWQSSTDANFLSNVTDISNSSATYTASNVSITTYYRAVVTNGTCPANSASTTIQVASGNLSADQNICFNTQPANISVSAYQGTFQKWQRSTDNISFADIAGAISATLTSAQIGNLVETTYFRAVIDGGVPCGEMNSNSVTVIVSTSSVGGSISPSEVSPAICPSATTVLTLSGYTGSILKWQSSPNLNFNNDVVDIFNYTNTLSVTNLTTTTYFRALVTNGGCAGAISTKAKINVINGGPVGGTLSPIGTALCSAANTTTLTLSGHNGTITKWQSSPVSNFSSGVIDVANTTATLTVTNLAVTTYYRVIITKNGCTANSAVAEIAVYPSITASISGNNGPICSGTNAVFNLSGTDGTIVTYTINGGSNQAVALTGGVGTVTITGAASNQTLTLVSVSSGICSVNLSGTSTVTVNLMPIVSISGNNGPVCSGLDAVFNLTGTAGANVTYTINGGSDQAVVLTGGSATVTITGATSDQILALVSVSLGSCSQGVSGNSTVTVNGTTTWTGLGGDLNWFNSANWSCNAIPNITSNVVVNSSNVIIAGNDAQAGSITLNGSSILTLNSGYDITVNNAVNTAASAVFILQNNANLLQVNDVSNSGNIEVNRQSSALMRLDYTLWSSPVLSQNLLAFSPLTVDTRFYVYNSVSNAYNSIPPATNNFQLGKGYLIRMPNNHPLTPTIWNGKFTGVPNNGNITLNSLYSGADGFRFNAIGNPYTSPIDMVSFVTTNASNITGTLYFWRKSNNTATDPGYCTWTTGGFTSNDEAQVFNPNGILRTGQGFIVEMLAGATSVSFNNTMRSGDNANQFFKSSSKSGSINGDRIWLNLNKSGGGFCQMLVGYFQNATLGVDNGIDGSVLGNPRPLLCSVIDNVDYAIQGRPPFVDTDQVVLNFKTTAAGQFTITIDHVDGLFLADQDIYLKDKLVNALHDLKTGGYVFASNAGDFPNRFEIVYRDPVLSTNSLDFNSQSLIVYKENQDLIVNANGVLLDNVKIFDIRGREIGEKTRIDADKIVFGNLNIANQVLLIQATSTEGVVVNKKIVF
jgi:hypothetical protein